MFNRFDQATIPVTDAFGMPFSSLRKRQVEESMPEVPLRPNDPAILAANQTNDMGMPIRQQEPQRPFVPEYQPPNPVGDLMPLPGVGGGGATTRQNIPEDDNTDQRNGQSINPLSSIALSKLQDFEAQGIPQQNPKLWQKLLALAAGAGSVVAAMNAERVRPDTQALSNMTNSILYPNEERNRARWLDQRSLLRDAVRSEQTGNENTLKQMELQQTGEINRSRAESESLLRLAQAQELIARGQLNTEKLNQLRNSKNPQDSKLADNLEQYMLWTAQRQIQSKDPEQVKQGQQIVDDLKKQKTEIEAKKNQPRVDNTPMALEMEAVISQIQADDKKNGITRPLEEIQKEARVKIGQRVQERQAADLAAKKRSANRPYGSSGSGSGDSGSGDEDTKEIAAAIIRGEQPPTTTGLYRHTKALRAELARNNYDLMTAQRDWKAIERHLATLNGPQQERLRQAVAFTYESLDVIEGLYKQWQKTGLATRFKTLNRATMALAKEMPGEPGAVANALTAQINDLVSDLGTIYKGGNSSTDESLRLAMENLKGNWNEETFKKSLGVIRQNLKIRRNSIEQSKPTGVSSGSPYIPTEQRGPQVGDIDGGYRFRGGDPSDPRNWERVE